MVWLLVLSFIIGFFLGGTVAWVLARKAAVRWALQVINEEARKVGVVLPPDPSPPQKKRRTMWG